MDPWGNIEGGSRTAKILMLHGVGQSGDFFHGKTRFLHEPISEAFRKSAVVGDQPSFPDGVEFHYPNGPIPTPRLSDLVGSDFTQQREPDIDWEPHSFNWGYGDWSTGQKLDPEEAIQSVLRQLYENGPYVGIIGFSSGATLGAIIASLLEPDRGNWRGEVEALLPGFQHPPLSFVVSFSGFTLGHQRFKSLYRPKIQTPLLHFMGNLDTIIPEHEKMKLVKYCQFAATTRFYGGHFVPRGQAVVDNVVTFIGNALGWSGISEPSSGASSVYRASLMW